MAYVERAPAAEFYFAFAVFSQTDQTVQAQNSLRLVTGSIF